MRGRWYVAGGVLTVLVVGACSNSFGGGGAHTAELGRAAPGSGAALGPDAAAGSAAASNPGVRAGVVDAAGGQPSGGVRGQLLVKSIPLVDGGYKIQIARMTVAVKGAKNVSPEADQAEAIAMQAGGEVDSDDRTSGPQASATLLLRVPPDTLTDTLTQLSGLGKEQMRTLSTSDVTQQVADVNSRVRSAQDSIARLRVLFDHATKIGDIIQLESELSSREADLESLQAQQRALARQTSMASITLSLVTAVKPPPAPPKPAPKQHENAFVTGLERGWHGFSAAAAWIAQAVATLLPFVVLLVVLGFALRLAWPRLPHRPRPPTPAPSE